MLPSVKEQFVSIYSGILEAKLIEEILDVGQYKRVLQGFSMMDIGTTMSFMPLILEGAMKILGEDQNDHEYLLYYLEMGESCAMTLSCCMNDKISTIKAIAEQDTAMIVVPIQKMEEWLIKYRSWRAFIFENYDSRMRELLETIDVLAFHNMEDRIYKYLVDRAALLNSNNLEITHYQIANDLNTSRVVVSRLIKKLMLQKKIKANRNSIEVLKVASV